MIIIFYANPFNINSAINNHCIVIAPLVGRIRSGALTVLMATREEIGEKQSRRKNNQKEHWSEHTET